MSKTKSRMTVMEDIRPDRATCRLGASRRQVTVITELDELMTELCWKRSSLLTQELLGIIKGGLKARELQTDIAITVSITVAGA